MGADHLVDLYENNAKDGEEVTRWEVRDILFAITPISELMACSTGYWGFENDEWQPVDAPYQVAPIRSQRDMLFHWLGDHFYRPVSLLLVFHRKNYRENTPDVDAKLGDRNGDKYVVSSQRFPTTGYNTAPDPDPSPVSSRPSTPSEE